MTKIKISGQEYEATVLGVASDIVWGGRHSKSITLAMDYATAITTFVDDGAFLIKN